MVSIILSPGARQPAMRATVAIASGLFRTRRTILSSAFTSNALFHLRPSRVAQESAATLTDRESPRVGGALTPTQPWLRSGNSGERSSLRPTAGRIADERPFQEIAGNQQPPTKMTSRAGEVVFTISLLESWCREGGSNPHGRKGRRILSPLRLPVPPSRPVANGDCRRRPSRAAPARSRPNMASILCPAALQVSHSRFNPSSAPAWTARLGSPARARLALLERSMRRKPLISRSAATLSSCISPG